MSYRKCTVMLFILLSVAVFSSCASDEEKRPTPEVEMATRAFALAEKVRDAYLSHDSESLRQLCSADLFGALKETMNHYEGGSIEFRMRWVDIDRDGTVHLYVSWKRSGGNGGEMEEAGSGMAVFVISGEPLRVEKVLRESPFPE